MSARGFASLGAFLFTLGLSELDRAPVIVLAVYFAVLAAAALAAVLWLTQAQARAGG